MWCAWCCACLFWAACSPHGAPCSEPLSWCSSRWALTSSKARAYSRLAFLPCSFFWPSRRASWAECPRYSDVSRSPKRLLEVNDMNYLRCGDVHKSYGGVKVLLGVNFEIRGRSEEHTSELQSLMRISYAVFCLQKKNNIKSTE